MDPECASSLAGRLEQYRSLDGGYHARLAAPHGTAYHGFLALGAYEDLGMRLPARDALRASVESLRCSTGGFSNDPDGRTGAAPATAAAVLILLPLATEEASALAGLGGGVAVLNAELVIGVRLHPDGLGQRLSQVVVGTGGGNLRRYRDPPLPSTEVRNDDTWGVLRLELHPDRYDWRFLPVDGRTFSDHGSGTCN